jgi:hypothetical protein
LEGKILVGVDLDSADPKGCEATLRMAGDANPTRIDVRSPNFVF